MYSKYNGAPIIGPKVSGNDVSNENDMSLEEGSFSMIRNSPVAYYQHLGGTVIL